MRTMLARARTRAGLLVAAAGFALLACDDLFVDPGAPTDAGLAIAISASASVRGDAADAFDRADQARVQLVRSNGDVVFDEVIDLPGAGEERAIDIEVELEGERETFQLRTQLLFQGQVLFDGTVTVTLQAGGTSSVDVPLAPVAAALDVRATAGPITAIGGTLQLTGAVVLATGDTIDDATIAWSSLDPAVATSTGAGLVTAVGEGVARIRARHEAQEDTVRVAVELAVGRIDVAPSSLTLEVGETRTATATVRDANGSPLARMVTWQSANADIAAVDAAGAVRGVAVGSTTVSASAGGVASEPIPVTVTAVPVASVSVSPSTATLVPGGTVQLEATLRDAAGNVLTGRSLQWSSDNATVATVSATGLVTAQGGGTARIIASSGARSDTVAITVDQPAIQLSTSGFTVTATGRTNPTTRTIGVANGGTGTLDGLTATVAYQGAATGWLSAQLSETAAPASLILNFDVAGLVPDAYVATVTVASTRPGVAPRTVRVELIVGGAPVAFVVVTPDRPRILVGDTVRLTATAYDSSQTVLPGRTATWRSDQPQIATVDANGLVTGVADGQALVHATVEGVPDSTVVTVALLDLQVSTNSVRESVGPEQNPPPRGIQVTNAGSSTLAGLTTSITYQGQQAGWLTALLDQTSTPATLTLSYAVSSFGPGTYDAQVTVASATPGVAPEVIDVSVTIAIPPYVLFDSSSVTFQTRVGVNPPAKVVRFANGGSGSLGTLTDTVQYSTTQSTGWLTPTLVQTGDTGTLTLSVDMSSVTPGTHFANVIVRSDDPAVGDGFLLVQLDATGLTVSIAGNGIGLGTVTGSGFDCTIDDGVTTGVCTLPFSPGDQLMLTAVADTFSFFTGWGGACAQTNPIDNPTCTVVVDGDLSVLANFTLPAEAPAAIEPKPVLTQERMPPT